jgi:hypothetical protein
MAKWLFVPYILELLSRGTFFRTLFFYFFRACAVIAALVGLVVCAGLLRPVLNLPAIGVIGGFVFIALTAVAFYAVAHIYWIRSSDIQQLASAKFTLIPIFAILVRTLGEVLATFITVVSVGGFIILLFAGEEAGGILSQVMPINPLSTGMERGGSSFIGALLVLVGGAICAVLLLASFYLTAEFISALAEIAISTGLTAANTSPLLASYAAPGAHAAPTPAAAAPRVPASKRCGFCGSVNPPGAAFCENCGKPI